MEHDEDEIDAPDGHDGCGVECPESPGRLRARIEKLEARLERERKEVRLVRWFASGARMYFAGAAKMAKGALVMLAASIASEEL